MDDGLIRWAVAKIVPQLHDTTEPPVWLLEHTLDSIKMTMVDDRHWRKFRPDEFKEACLQAAKATTRPEQKLLIDLTIMEVVGQIAETPENALLIKMGFDHWLVQIGQLPSSRRENRLRYLWHQRVLQFSEVNGFYGQAAVNAKFLAAHDTTPEKQAIMAFRSRLFSFWDTLVEPKKRQSAARLNELVDGYGTLTTALADKAERGLWLECRGPTLLVQGHILARVNVPHELWKELNSLVMLAALEVPSLKDWVRLFSIMDQDDPELVWLIEVARDPIVVMTAEFALAMTRFENGFLDQAEELCDQIIKRVTSNSHMIKGAAIHLKKMVRRARSAKAK